MEITHEDRVEFLKAYNNLRNILTNIHECQDLWMSDIRNLESMEYLMRRVMKFSPQRDDEGNQMHYSDWVIKEDGDE